MLLKSYWIMVVMDVFTRRIIGFGVAPADLDGPVICRMFNRAIARETPPKYLSSDNDPLFRLHRWCANLRILEVDEIKTIPCTPLSHPFVERLIGTVRREYLDRTFFWNRGDLERKLDNYQAYYNQHRCHTGLAGATPAKRSGGPTQPSAKLVIYLAATLSGRRWRADALATIRRSNCTCGFPACSFHKGSVPLRRKGRD